MENRPPGMSAHNGATLFHAPQDSASGIGSLDTLSLGPSDDKAYGITSNGVPLEGSAGRKTLHVGNLNQRVTERMLSDVFGVAGGVKVAKVVQDKSNPNTNYGFVEYEDPRCAVTAMNTLAGRKIYDMEMKISWSFQKQLHKSSQSPQQGILTPQSPSNIISTPSHARKASTSSKAPPETHSTYSAAHHQLFVGDLSAEVDETTLWQAFSRAGPSLSDARVMWDPNTKRSRGYGFVSFADRSDADRALELLQGKKIGSRTVRVSRANTQPSKPTLSSQESGAHARSASRMSQSSANSQQQPYSVVLAQSPAHNTTVYVGNVPPTLMPNDLVVLFAPYGFITEVKLQSERGFAFVRFGSHEAAAMAISRLPGTVLQDRTLKFSWGKATYPNAPQFDSYHMPVQGGAPYAHGYMPAVQPYEYYSGAAYTPNTSGNPLWALPADTNMPLDSPSPATNTRTSKR